MTASTITIYHEISLLDPSINGHTRSIYPLYMRRLKDAGHGITVLRFGIQYFARFKHNRAHKTSHGDVSDNYSLLMEKTGREILSLKCSKSQADQPAIWGLLHTVGW
jgi:hypothetical protein